MGNGYVRQSAADIQNGLEIRAAPLNAEFNALRDFADGTSGHSHDGTTGEGPLISLTTSINGILPVVNGGIGGINKLNATVAPAVTDDTGDGYVVGSHWIDITADKAYIALDVTLGAAVWVEMASVGGLTLVSTDAGAASGPTLTLFRNSATPTDGDFIGLVNWDGKSSTGVTRTYTQQETFIKTVNNGIEQGTWRLGVMANGALVKLSYDGTNFGPSVNDTVALGSITSGFSDLYLAEGGVINWDNSDATLTQVGNLLTLAGADFVAPNIIVNTALLPDANDGAALGTTALQFSDLFLAEGGVINWDNGDVTLTQIGNDLALGGGWLTLPNDGLHILDTNATHALIIAPGSNLTAERTLTITTGDADHTLDISGAPTSVIIATGTYTPTLTNTTNVAASVASVLNYMRVGDMVTVSGILQIDPTTVTTLTELGISLPIASNFAANSNVGGAGASVSGANEAWAYVSDATNDRVTMTGTCTNAANHFVAFSFMYRVI